MSILDLQAQYGKTWRVKLCQPIEGCYEIPGKRGYIRNYGDDLELYLSNLWVANRVERSYPAFKPKNHYDDATAFVFANKPELVTAACKWIKARKRFQFSPEVLERKRAAIARVHALNQTARSNEGL